MNEIKINNFINNTGNEGNLTPVGSNPLHGKFRGEGVIVMSSISSQIQDAAEELTFSISEKSEKDLASREISETKKTRFLEQIKKIDKLKEMQQKLPSMDLAKLQQFIDKYKLLKNPDEHQCSQLAKQFSNDPSEQYALLTITQSVIDDKDQAQLGDSLQLAIDTLLEQDGENVRAGLNVSQSSKLFADKGLGDLQQLRDNYRQQVSSDNSLVEIFDNLLENYPREDFDHAVQFMLNALTMDLNSDGTSVAKEKLKTIIDHIYQLEVISGIKESAELLIKKMLSRGVNMDLIR